LTRGENTRDRGPTKGTPPHAIAPKKNGSSGFGRVARHTDRHPDTRVYEYTRTIKLLQDLGWESSASVGRITGVILHLEY